MKTKKEAQAGLARASSIIEMIAQGKVTLADAMPLAMSVDDLLEEVAEFIEEVPDDDSSAD